MFFMLHYLRGASTLNLGILGKIYFFAYYERAVLYLELEKNKSLRRKLCPWHAFLCHNLQNDSAEMG